MVTIKDVARAAGVSVTTVSHAVNRTRHVNPDTIEKVQATIEQLGYQPSGVARALKSNRTQTVGMIVTSSTNPFFAEVIRGVETGCFDLGYSLMLCNSGDVAQKLTAYLRTLMMKRIDALLVMTNNASSDFFRRLEQIRTVPIIALDTTIPRVDCMINDDSLLGGRLAGAHLAGKGFARIGCITGPAGHPHSAERLAGFTAALAEAGITLCAGASGDADEAVAAWLLGNLENSGVNCDHHDHDDGCSCGDHDCGEHGCGGCSGCHHGPVIEGKNAGKKCLVHYRGTFNDGTQFDSSYDRGEPLEFICGVGMMIPGFDAAVAVMDVGETRQIHLMPEEAYGESDPNAIFTVETAQLPGSEDLPVGTMVYLQSVYGDQVPARVIAADGKTVTFDTNHEMAGKELNFTIELTDVRDA